jgi:hypothetical protein
MIIYEAPKRILYNSPTADYKIKSTWNEPKEAEIIGEDNDSYFTREYLPGKYIGIHKSRLIKFLPNPVQLNLF